MNSKLYIFVEGFSHLIILNFLWILSCIPIVTIFPATSAMVSVIRHWKTQGGVTRITHTYFKYFKNNFVQNFILGVIWLIFAAILSIDYFFLAQISSNMKTVLIVCLLIVCLLFLATSVFLFPVVTHYQVNIKYAIKNSFLLSIVYFPTTLIILLNIALLVVILYIAPLTGLIAFSLLAFVNYSLCHSIFQRVDRLNNFSS